MHIFFLWQCQYDGCHQSFKKSSQLTRHICVHTNESPFKYVGMCNEQWLLWDLHVAMFLYLQHAADLYNFVANRDVCYPLKEVLRIYVK